MLNITLNLVSFCTQNSPIFLHQKFCTSAYVDSILKTHMESLPSYVKIHLISKAVVLLLLTFCLLLLPLWGSVIVLCFVVRYFMSILVLHPS